eukprot:TRINITY_DN45686_c0_g1_i1.p1 TRINITY_DN45686_c0_g1~~TRINITY_DN45686_c0_g1_i1.p1  ORF type:complete len:263 (-),score=50.74 TRINITY_DN45686_c0_g1_i1:60-848(-)
MAAIDTVLFDVDDTLYPASSGFSDHRNGEVICQFMVDELGFDSFASAKALRDEYFQRYHSTMKGLNVAMQEGRLPKQFQQEKLARYWADHCDFAKYVPVDHAQLKHLQSLQQEADLKLAVFTNSPKAYAIKCLKSLGLCKIFSDEMVFGVEDVLPDCKPQRKAFQKVLDALGSVPERTVMFEDSMKNIQACKTLGIHTVLVNEGLAGSSGEAELLNDTPRPGDPSVDAVLKDLKTLRSDLPGLWQKLFEPVSESPAKKRKQR